jgi:hypothetical protein
MFASSAFAASNHRVVSSSNAPGAGCCFGSIFFAVGWGVSTGMLFVRSLSLVRLRFADANRIFAPCLCLFVAGHDVCKRRAVAFPPVCAGERFCSEWLSRSESIPGLRAIASSDCCIVLTSPDCAPQTTCRVAEMGVGALNSNGHVDICTYPTFLAEFDADGRTAWALFV